jgi:Mg-chelatase subunit ChlD
MTHHRRGPTPLPLAALLVCVAASATHAAPAVLFTADTEGHAGPCDTCPHGRGLGGLDRRATLVAGQRQGGPVVLVDAGNALFGNDDSGAGPLGGARLVAQAYAKTGYDAANLSYRDFRAGRDATLKLIEEVGLTAVSANLVDAAGRPVVKPYVVIDCGGEKVAVVGVTEAPRGLEFLPHLKQQLAGLRVEPPAAALKTYLPKAKAEAARVVVAYHGSAAGLQAVRAEAAAGGAEAVLVGGVRPESLPSNGAPPLVGAAEHGKYVTRLAGGRSEQLAVDASLVPDPAVRDLIAAGRRAALDAEAGASEATVRVKLPSLPPRPQLDKLYPVCVTTGNRGARFDLLSAGIVGSYGTLPADAGPYLVLSTRWENVIPLTVVRDQKVPTEYQIPNLADHLYAVIDGRRLARVHPQGAEQPGHVPVKDFKLPKIGASITGNVVFALPPGTGAQDLKSIEVRFYDYAHGHFSVPLLAASEVAQEKPVSAPQVNEVLEVGVYGIGKEKTLSGRGAPEGMTFVTVDLRARSKFTVDADANAFDPKARPGQKTKVGHVADWKESRRYLQLVADGEYAYMPEPQTQLPEEPRFLPDVMTGDTLVFLAPADTKSLELRCDFPNAKASTGGAVFRPKGITLALEGKAPAPSNEKPVASVDDDNYRVQVTRQAQAAEFAGQAAPAGKKFLVLDVTVQNRGSRNGEFFQTTQQLKYAAETGEQLPLSPVTFQGVHRPAELVWVPPTDRRSFQAVFEVGAGEKRPRLAFTGVSKAQVLNLNPVEAMAADTAPGPAPAVAAKGKQADAPTDAPAGRPTEVATNAPARPAPPATTPPMRDAPQLKAPDPAKDVKALRVTAKQPHQSKGLAGVGLTAEQVNDAIDRGAEFLWQAQKKDMKERNSAFGRQLGYDVLVGLALVHANYHHKNPEFDAELRAMMATTNPSDLGTYGAGIFAMLIEHYGDGYYLPKLKQTVRCILDNQYRDGTWGYNVNLDDKLLRDPGADRVLQIRGGIPLEGPGAVGTPMDRVTPFDTKNNYSGDNSTTQYALLGLWAASRATTPVVPGTWELALASYRNRQCDDGGWAYTGAGGAAGYGSMTAAGVCSVAIARHQLGEKEPAVDEAVERGLAWLANHFSVSTHPQGSSAYLYYYLYSVERVGRVLDTEFIGPHEWYPLGARFLVDGQSPQGQWKGSGEEEKPQLANSFALLFLTRATSSLNVAQKRGGNGKLRTDVAVAPGNRVYIILDCSGSMLPEIDGKQKFEIARDAVRALVDSLPDTSEIALRAYGHRLNARQEKADEDTELLLPMGKLDRKAFNAKLFPLRARGKTPLALSLKQAAQDLGSYARDDKNPVTVVLLTDGGEDTRARLDPIAEAAALAKLPGLNLQVVGFDINRPDWTQQLQAIARSGGGQYLTAARADGLLRELKAAVFRVPETFVVTTPKGQPVMQAPFGTEKVLPEGQYVFTTGYGGRRFAEPFWINTDATTAIVFDASKLGVDKGAEAVAETGAAPVGDAPAATPALAGQKKFCTSCGAPLAATAKFCTKCGTKVGG